MKDFGDILKEWEEKKSLKPNLKKGQKSIHSNLNSWLQTHEIEDKDALLQPLQEEKRIRYKKLAIDEKIDLHGSTKEEAIKRLYAFFDEAIRKKYKKVLIIHGKGKHSVAESVLSRVVKEFLEKHPNAGRHEHAKNAEGGSGATWVIIKRENI